MLFRPSVYFVIVGAAIIVPGLSVLGYNLYIDPFQIMRKDRVEPAVVLSTGGCDRYQHAGIINHYPMKSVIIGHSHSANYLPSMMEDILGVAKTVTLTMDGSSIADQSVLAQRVLQKQNVEYILWGINDKNLMNRFDQRGKRLALPDYLYDKNRLNDLRFFVTFDLHKYKRRIKNQKKWILKSTNPKAREAEESDRATSWYWRNEEAFDRPLFVAHQILGKRVLKYDEAQLSQLVPLTLQTLETAADRYSEYLPQIMENANGNIDKNLVPLVSAHPDVQFDFVFTAFPTLLVQTQKLFTRRLYIASFLVIESFIQRLADYENVRVFAFGLEPFADNLRLYKDRDHYHIAVNNYIIQRISQNGNRITSENITSYLLAFDRKINQYRLPEEWNPISLKNVSDDGRQITISAAELMVKQLCQDPDK